jgi:uncharacterized protein (DUF58 family)
VLIENYPAEPPVRVMTPPLRRGGQAVVALRVTPLHRGYWEQAGEDRIEAYSPLGGFVRRSRISHKFAAPRWVHPAPVAPIPIPDTALGASTDAAGSSRSGPGIEFFGIREWRSGDSASSVHWRASARRNQLVVMDRERPAKAALVVVVGPATAGPSWEHAVARAAATAVAARRSGQPVTLVCGAATATPESRNDVLDWFAELGETPAADSDDPIAGALRAHGPGATILWLASEPAPDALNRLAWATAARIIPVDPVAEQR